MTMLTLRSNLFTFLYMLTGIVYGTLSLLICWLPKRLRHRLIVSWTALSMLLLRLCCGVRYQVKGLHHIRDAKQPLVIMSKHQSTWETLFLQRACFPASTVLKKELLKIPFFGWGLSMLSPIAIDRSNPREAIKQIKAGANKRLQQGYHVIIFPEGTRVKPGEKNKYARGGADIAISSGSDIVPVALNSGQFWPTDSKQKIPGVIQVVIGPPISSAGKNSKSLTDEVEHWIETQMLELHPTATS